MLEVDDTKMRHERLAGCLAKPLTLDSKFRWIPQMADTWPKLINFRDLNLDTSTLGKAIASIFKDTHGPLVDLIFLLPLPDDDQQAQWTVIPR